MYFGNIYLIDPPAAIELYDLFERNLKFGISNAQTYYWLHSMNTGQLRSDVTADYPIALSFNNNGQLTYVAHNYSNSPISVSFSDGFVLYVGPYDMATNRGSDIKEISHLILPGS